MCGHAFLGPRAARHGGGDQPAHAALVGERVEEGIARCVGDLAAAAPYARDRGDQHESIQGLPLEQGVQMDGTGHLGCDHLCELGCVHLGQWGEPAADPRGVHDRFDRHLLGGDSAWSPRTMRRRKTPLSRTASWSSPANPARAKQARRSAGSSST
jgi:hypothetical protein